MTAPVRGCILDAVAVTAVGAVGGAVGGGGGDVVDAVVSIAGAVSGDGGSEDNGKISGDMSASVVEMLKSIPSQGLLENPTWPCALQLY